MRRIFGSIQIEVTRNNYGRRGILTCGIPQDLVDLGETQFIISPAFHMKVVGKKLAACNIDLGYQCDSSSKPLLEWLNPRQEPARLPKVRLS